MLLAIDTATRVISIALHDGTRLIAESSWQTANYHTVELAPAVKAMMSRAGLTLADLKAVAVALGPGSFTGLRIGMGFAKGLVAALDVPLIGVPTLAILAHSQARRRGLLIAVLQAGRGRICAQKFRWRGRWDARSEPVITSWDALLDEIEKEVTISGEIDEESARQLAEAIAAGKAIIIAPVADRLRRAGYLADVAQVRLKNGDVDDPYTLVPIYLHQPGVPHP